MKKGSRQIAKVVYNEEIMKRKSIDELKDVAKLRRIKNSGKLKKEGLITSLLKSEISNADRNNLKYFNNNTNVSHNTKATNNTIASNNNTNTNVINNTNDGKIRDKISDIRAILSRLEDIVTKNDREKIKKELYEIENKTNISDGENERIDDNLLELVNKLNKKEKYRYHDRDDLDYHGIRDIENLFDADNNEDYYKPILVKSSFNESYKYYKSRGDKDKKLSIEQYLDVIKPYLSDLINDHKAIETSSNEWKIQINMHINFVSSNDTGEIRTVFVWSDNEETRLGDETDDIVKRINPFLNNYQREELILRNKSSFVFESVDLLSYHIHKTTLNRGSSYINSPEWIASKKAIIDPENSHDKCFKYSIVVALNHKEFKNHPERLSNTHYFFSYKYNWEDIEYPAGIKDRKRFNIK